MKQYLDENLSILSNDEGIKECDMVNHPLHYNTGKIEVIDMIKDTMTHTEFIGYLWGNILKYLHRWPHKNGIEDLKKAQWYLDKLINELKGE